MHQMTINKNKLNIILYALECVGAVFVAIFLAAYLGGLPTTIVLHSEPTFRISLIVFGAVLLVLVISLATIGIFAKKK